MPTPVEYFPPHPDGNNPESPVNPETELLSRLINAVPLPLIIRRNGNIYMNSAADQLAQDPFDPTDTRAKEIKDFLETKPTDQDWMPQRTTQVRLRTENHGGKTADIFEAEVHISRFPDNTDIISIVNVSDREKIQEIGKVLENATRTLVAHIGDSRIKGNQEMGAVHDVVAKLFSIQRNI